VLNDLSRFIRTSAFLQLLGPGFAAGALVGAFVVPLDTAVGAAELALLGVALLLIVGWAVWHGVTLRRTERRLWDEVAAGSEELLAAPVGGALPARVVRGRPKRALAAYAMAHGRQPGPAVALAATLVGDGPARRVGLLAPASAVLPPGAALLVVPHPTRREVAVLDDRVTAAEVAASAADPRWAERLPTDRSVIGGWTVLLACSAAGLVVGAVVGLGIALLVT
jgi:hypothetical protein